MLQQINNENSLIKLQQSAELDVQISTAKHYPRDENKSLESAKKNATLSKDIASSCAYTLPRGDKKITGASIRLAEIIMNNWGNLHAATRVVENNGKSVTSQAVVWDLEKNVRIITEVTKPTVYGKKSSKAGQSYDEDMRLVTASAASSIALRNAVFKVIPKSIIDEVYRYAMEFIAYGGKKPADKKEQQVKLREGAERAFNLFEKNYEIDENTILVFLSRKSKDEITFEDLNRLAGIKTSIDDGEIIAKEAFKILDNTTDIAIDDKLSEI